MLAEFSASITSRGAISARHYSTRTKYTEKDTTMTETGTVIVVLGTDRDGKRRAARLTGAQAEQARKAAGATGLHALCVSEPDLKKLAAKLEPARIAADGTASLPTIDNTTYDKLAKLIGTDAELKAPAEPAPSAKTEKAPSPQPGPAKSAASPWEALDVGSVVLCHDAYSAAWYEAVVLSVERRQAVSHHAVARLCRGTAVHGSA
jgi:hypothetical protein